MDFLLLEAGIEDLDSQAYSNEAYNDHGDKAAKLADDAV